MFELKPTDENVENTLIENLLDRNKTVFQFLKILYSLKEQYSLCLDGNWGTGKTFFIKQCIRTIELLNMTSDKVDGNLKEFKNKLDSEFNEIKCEKELFPIYFNAWEYDSNRDPLIAFIYSLINDMNLDLSIKNVNDDSTFLDKLKKLMSSFKFGGTITDEKTGMSYGAEIQYTPQDKPNMLKDVTSIKNIEQQFTDLLNSILPERANKIIIFIDELDRCNPIFAVKLLENFKHFFNNDKFIFVFSTNILELKNTINNFYGNNFNSSYYLQKFFDLQFELPKANLEKYINNQLKLNFTGWQEVIINEIMHIFNFSLRDCNRYFSMYNFVYNYMITSNWGENKKAHALIKYVIFPTLLALKIKKFELYNNIVCGNAKEDFIQIFSSNDEFIRVIHSILRGIPEQDIDIAQLINDLYENLFIKSNVHHDTMIMNGKICIEQINVDTLNIMLSFINNIITLS